MKIRAQKLASLPTPFNNVRASTSTTTSVMPTSTRLKWTPSKADDEHGRADDGAQLQPASRGRQVAGISVLKQDKLDGSATLSNTLPTSTSLNEKIVSQTNDAVDISDIENSLSDVSGFYIRYREQ